MKIGDKVVVTKAVVGCVAPGTPGVITAIEMGGDADGAFDAITVNFGDELSKYGNMLGSGWVMRPEEIELRIPFMKLPELNPGMIWNNTAANGELPEWVQVPAPDTVDLNAKPTLFGYDQDEFMKKQYK